MAIAEWKYPFPSRTRKSSALTPMVLQRCGRVGSRQALFFRPSSACGRFASSIRAKPCTQHCRRFGSSPCIAACFGWNSILHASSSSIGASSPHHSQCIRGRSVASVASVVVVASVVSVTFVPSVASVVHARCPLLEKTSKCGQFFVRFSPKNKNADIALFFSVGEKLSFL